MKKWIAAAAILALAVCLCACTGQPDGDVEVSPADIVEANSLDVLLDRYNNVFIQEDTVNINGFVESTAYYHFETEDGRFVGDVWQDDEAFRMAMNARGGIIYGVLDGDMNAVIVPEAEYNDQVAELYPLLPAYGEDQVISAVKEDKEILVTTVRETFDDGSPSLGAEYRLNARTLRINSLQVISYNEEGQKTQIIGMTVTFNSKETPDRSAWETISNPQAEEACTVNAVIEPGTQQEEKRNLQVARSCSIEVAGKSQYGLYSDAACENPVSVVDTTGENITFYAKAEE